MLLEVISSANTAAISVYSESYRSNRVDL